jgi:hypothetical protein
MTKSSEKIIGWFDYSTALYERSDFEIGDKQSIQIYMAKNEKEGFQYLLTSNEDYSDLICKMSDLTDGKGHSLSAKVFCAHYTNISNKGRSFGKFGWFPDALVEQKHSGFSLKAGQSQTLYIQYTTDINTEPGVYTGKLSILNNESVLLQGDVTVTVWNICYSEETACVTAFGNDAWTIWCEAFDGKEHLKEYYDFMLENRISSYYLPYDFSDDKADAYMDNPRVTSFLANFADEKGPEKIKSSPNRLKKAYIYSVDEPLNDEMRDKVVAHCKQVTEEWVTNSRIIFPFFEGPPVDFPGKSLELIERTKEYTKLWCTRLKSDNKVSGTLQNLQQTRGDERWWYICGQEEPDLVNFLGNTPGLDKRIVFWQMFQNDIRGMLYWCYGWWRCTGNIWEENHLEGCDPKWGWAVTDGVLLYWDPETGGPIGTLGLESIRDGIEDYQLLTMCCEKLGREEVMKAISKVTTALNSYTKDAQLLLQVRMELARLLEGNA